MSVERWGAWAPGLESHDQWRHWALSPSPIGAEGTPPLPWVAPRLRRRCSTLSRMALQAAFSCMPEEGWAEPATVFATRHGEIDTTIALLQDLAAGELLSAHGFSHSVHNTPAGHYSILAGNRHPSASVAGAEATFGYGFLEAATALHRYPGRPVLLVMADVPLPEPLDRFNGPDAVPYGAALLLSAAGTEGSRLDFGFTPSSEETTDAPPLPQALAFLAWMLTGAPRLALEGGGMTWRWTREGKESKGRAQKPSANTEARP